MTEEIQKLRETLRNAEARFRRYAAFAAPESVEQIELVAAANEIRDVLAGAK